MNQLERIKEIIDWRNKNIQNETYATHIAFDSIEDIINFKETEINSTILNNINADEKLKIICRTKSIDANEMASDICRNIRESVYCDKDEFVGEYTQPSTDGWSCGEEFGGYILFLNKVMLMTEEEEEQMSIDGYGKIDNDWLMENCISRQLSDESKKFIALALDCGVDEIFIR